LDVGDDPLHETAHAILAAIGRRIQVPVGDARLLRLHSNAIFVLPSAGLLVRIATNPAALTGVRAAVAVTRWLAARGFPCVVPADIDDQPLVERDRAVSIWRYVPTVPDPPATGSDLGRLLRVLHAEPLPPHPPGQLDDPFDSVANAIEEAPEAMSDIDRSWLSDRIAELRELWPTIEFPHPLGLIHGDAHPNNLMRMSSGGIILGDWDHVAVGPREWDLLQIHYTRRRFGRPSEKDIEGFTTAYGWDIRGWPGLDTLIAVRELTGLSPYIRTAPTKTPARQELAHRLGTLRRQDTMARWTSPPPE
jgi:aminoglycoside phosphotransferase (APT) family kinase protein